VGFEPTTPVPVEAMSFMVYVLLYHNPLFCSNLWFYQPHLRASSGCAMIAGADMEINVLIDEGLEGCVDEVWLQGIAGQTLVAQNVSSNAELGLVIAGQERVQELNRDYLGKDRPTDVLAFSMLPAPTPPETPEADFLPFVTPSRLRSASTR